MIDSNYAGHVYLAGEYTDMRKSIDGLAVLVQHAFELDPFSPAIFVFCNRQRDKIKLLAWDINGFWLHYRRLERGRFQWPSLQEGETLTIRRRELRWLLDGLSLSQRQAHAEVRARTIV